MKKSSAVARVDCRSVGRKFDMRAKAMRPMRVDKLTVFFALVVGLFSHPFVCATCFYWPVGNHFFGNLRNSILFNRSFRAVKNGSWECRGLDDCRHQPSWLFIGIFFASSSRSGSR